MNSVPSCPHVCSLAAPARSGSLCHPALQNHLPLLSYLCVSSGLLIDFGLAEPAEKWKGRTEALANHRVKRARRKKSRDHKSLELSRKTGNQRNVSGCSARENQPTRPCTAENESLGNFSVPPQKREELGVEGSCASSGKRNDGFKLLRKAERGGTTGFRAPEILWHSREQVGGQKHRAIYTYFVHSIANINISGHLTIAGYTLTFF